MKIENAVWLSEIILYIWMCRYFCFLNEKCDVLSWFHFADSKLVNTDGQTHIHCPLLGDTWPCHWRWCFIWVRCCVRRPSLLSGLSVLFCLPSCTDYRNAHCIVLCITFDVNRFNKADLEWCSKGVDRWLTVFWGVRKEGECLILMYFFMRIRYKFAAYKSNNGGTGAM